MKVEILIYAYLAICSSMIIFNIVCIFIFRKKDKDIQKRSIDFTDSITEQLEKESIDDSHKLFLQKKLKRVNHLMAFDETLEKLYKERPEQIKAYIEKLSSVFVYLTLEYSKKNKVQAAYFPYIIKKYSVLKGTSISIVIDMLLDLVKEENLYCRENALNALYSIGDAESVITALKILNKNSGYHHPKMIADGLLSFSGDRERLNQRIWENIDGFSVSMREALLDYFRFESGSHCEKMLRIMTDSEENQELRFCAIRYFAKYRYEPALPFLYDFACEDSPVWEYKAIAASALANYPVPKTEEVLKELLTNRNWYVRYNASDSLEKLGVGYDELIDIFEGGDRYASEMLRYRFDRKKLNQEEVTV